MENRTDGRRSCPSLAQASGLRNRAGDLRPGESLNAVAFDVNLRELGNVLQPIPGTESAKGNYRLEQIQWMEVGSGQI